MPSPSNEGTGEDDVNIDLDLTPEEQAELESFDQAKARTAGRVELR